MLGLCRINMVLQVGLCALPKPRGSPKPQCLKTCPYLERGSSQMELAKLRCGHRSGGWGWGGPNLIGSVPLQKDEHVKSETHREHAT